jgi:outer membrane protein assembly factor BamB
LVVAGRAGTRCAVPAALLLALTTAVGAQPAPRPATPAKAGAVPQDPLDRRRFPFFPLQTVWTLNIGAAPATAAATDGVSVFVPVGASFNAFSLATGAGKFGQAYASLLPPVAADGRLLVTGDKVIDALTTQDGSPLWKAPLTARALFPPASRGGWVFVALADGLLAGLRADTGAAVWALPVGTAAAPPVVEGDRLYVATTGAGLQAIGVTDGAAAWQVTLDSDATALTAVAGHVFVATSGRWLYALDAAKGRVRWRFRIQGAAIGLAVDEDRVIAVMLDQSVRAFKIGSGAQAWRQELSFRPAGGPVVTGHSVLVTGFGPSLLVVDRTTGARQGTYAIPVPTDASGLSLETLAAGPLVWTGATVFDDVVFLMTQNGVLHAARRAFDPPATPLSVLPGTVVPVPAPPPGMPATPDQAPAPTVDAPAAPGKVPGTGPTTAPATTPPAAAPPAADTPPRTPPAPPAR